MKKEGEEKEVYVGKNRPLMADATERERERRAQNDVKGSFLRPDREDGRDDKRKEDDKRTVN